MGADPVSSACPASPTARLIRRAPVTTALLATLLIVGISTGTAWTPLRSLPWFEQVAFGWPALAGGRWWTVLTGSFLARTPVEFWLMPPLVVLGVGICEWRLGTRRTLPAACGLQIAGVVLASLAVGTLAATGWGWAAHVARSYDAGISAAYYGCAGVMTSTLRAPWRGRLRLFLLALTIVPLVYIGRLADLIHVIAVLIALPLGPLLCGRRPQWRLPSVSRREVRLLSSSFFALSAGLTVIGHLTSGDGMLGPFGGGWADPWWWTIVSAILDLAVAWGLLHGRRTWWWFATALTSLTLIAATAGTTLVLLLPSRPWESAAVAWTIEAFQLALLLVGRGAFRNPGRLTRKGSTPSQHIASLPTEAERSRARDVLERVGSANRLSWITTWSENRWWFPADIDGFVAYQLHAGMAIGLCDPVGAPDRVPLLADSFVAAAQDAGRGVCFFSSTSRIADWARDRGWTVLTVAQEAVIDLPSLEFRGKRWQDIRTAFNQASKLGVTHRLIRLATAPRDIRRQVAAISDQWVGDKALPEMGFTLGGVEEAEDPDVWVGIAEDGTGRIHGVTSWLPGHMPGGPIESWTLDVMRKAPECFRYTMEFLIASACREFRSRGCLTLSLSGAPLAAAVDAPQPADALDRVVNRLGATLEPYYGFGSLERFKKKFQPRHVPLYLAAPDEAALARAGIAVARAYLAHATPLELVKLLHNSR
ncbi:bifunctional lysylphosphatidylglycerol flippase/synthetase MprF [Propionicicella superfundia]|uniref:bifunctional lysylphosphatidylglycerol flippase/synthetase MprF n=1 Tax=Propionicicella superfundia TaxID=348582 RepID=UPI000429C0E0|nr:phosphatidylglycerol lysyltransferase domain-containing protein [Propionicicella superfundia]